MKTLVTGAARSGKSVVAERLLGELSSVSYVACGRRSDENADPEWAARVAAHRQRRPSDWLTVESTDLPAALDEAAGPVLVDCLGTWLTAQLDELDAWNLPAEAWEPRVRNRVDATVAAVKRFDHRLVLVTNEVGWGLVSEHRSGRIFADRLGWVNQSVAAACDDVLLVVAGRVITL